MAQSVAFENVPIEIFQQIASYLPNDQDVGRFRLISRATQDAIDADSCSFWRTRFLTVYESPAWTSTRRRLSDNQQFRDQYKKRQQVLKSGLRGQNKGKFSYGHSGAEKKCLQVLRQLIVESFSDKRDNNSGKTYESCNLRLILGFVAAHGLLYNIRNRQRIIPPTPDALFTAIKCVLAPTLFSLTPDLRDDHMGFNDAQKLAYEAAVTVSIFGGCSGLDINMHWLHAQIVFWRHHMLAKNDGLLQHEFAGLDETDRPRYWSSQLTEQPAQKLNRHWKGSYAFVDRDVIAKIRRGDGLEDHILDEMSGEQTPEPFQHILLGTENANATPWPQNFEYHLRSLVPPVVKARTRAQNKSANATFETGPTPQSLRFDGDGYDASEDFMASGWLSPLPPQYGIPGWQRMTMMKYFVDEDTGAVDVDALWAYEGVMLPGGQMMLGRWWCPSDGTGMSMYSGPFILWAVDDDKYGDTVPR